MDEFHDNDIEQIAIIGMAGRFPGARNIDQFWQNLREGKECTTKFSEAELLERGVPKEEFSHPDYVKSGAVLDGIDLFDAEFFGYNAKEAEIMDPQQRIFLELAWEALEDAGCNPENYDGAIGVFGGAGGNDYRERIGTRTKNVTFDIDAFQSMLGNDADYLATRVSYKLNLKGPSLTLQTACSTSLVAIHTACQFLLTYQCDAALAGGISIRLPQGVGYRYREGMIWSPDGHCRAFDAKAQGVYLGHGAGIVVLKRLSEAIDEGDNIYAVIKGSAINNDGALKAGFTAPSVDGQAGAISMAQSVAGVSPESISYVEAHGTGTLLGDPVEVEALINAFRVGTPKKNFCALGSVKTNIGHLDAAAGIAGLIKTVLSLKNTEIPPSLHYKEPNPNIDFANSPFYVNAELRDWPSAIGPRRAGVSAFGIGGTNAHVVLEEAPVQHKRVNSRPWQLLLLSAKSEEGVGKAAEKLARHLQENPGLSLADVAYTLQAGRQHFDCRRPVVCKNVEDAIDLLAGEVVPVHRQQREIGTKGIVFMFSGQGSQYVGMAEGLYKAEVVFREHLDYCVDILKPQIDLDLRDVLFPGPENISVAKELITQTRITQPALFVIEYCLAKLLMSWGITPKAMVGHSIGEYVAACLAGVFSLEDALHLVAQRGQLMQSLPPGFMLAVPLSEEELTPLLPVELSVAVINAPAMTVLSGDKNAISAFQEKLAKANILDSRILHTSHAFHSHMMEPIVEEFAKTVSSFVCRPPMIPFVSNVTGGWITNEEATAPEYWARHLRQPVRFFSCLTTLFAEKKQVLLEVGPSQVLTTLTRQHPDSKEHVVLAATRRPIERSEDMSFLLTTLGQLWAAGCAIDWQRFSSQEPQQKISLPGYPFARKRYWQEAVYVISETVRSTGFDELTVSNQSISAGDQNNTAGKKSKVDMARSVKQIFSDLSGIPCAEFDETITFSEYGFDSLLLTQIASALSDHFGISVLFRQLTNETPNFKKLIEDITRRREETVNHAARRIETKGKNLIAIQPHGKKIPFILVHGDGVNNFFPDWLDDDQPFYGYLHQGADGEEIRYKTVEDIAAHYLEELLHVFPDGPYILGGFSFGGLVAYEMASELLKQGKDVRRLIVLDSAHPSYLREEGRLRSFRNLGRKIRGIARNIWKYHLHALVTRIWLILDFPGPVTLRTGYILSTYILAACRYYPSKISCPVTLLKAIDTIYTESTSGWGVLLGEQLNVYQVPGTHLSMIRSKDNFLVLARYLCEQIEKAQEELNN